MFVVNRKCDRILSDTDQLSKSICFWQICLVFALHWLPTLNCFKLFFQEGSSVPLQSTDSVKVDNDGGWVQFQPLHETNKGKYKCKAVNDVGDAEAEGQLTVLGLWASRIDSDTFYNVVILPTSIYRYFLARNEFGAITDARCQTAYRDGLGCSCWLRQKSASFGLS